MVDFIGANGNDPEAVPEPFRCVDNCVQKAMEKVSNLATRKIEHNGDTYVSIDDLGDVFGALISLQTEFQRHSPMGADDIMFVRTASEALAMNVANYLYGHGTLTDAQVPDTIPAEWLGGGN